MDLTELMKTGLFELRYEKSGDWVITPLIGDVSVTIHDGEEWGSESNFPFEYPKGWAESNPEFTDNLKDFSTWDKNIPWHKIPERYKWAAMDKDGKWYAYEEEPGIVVKGQWSCGCNFWSIAGYRMPSPPDWTKSLVRRPSYE